MKSKITITPTDNIDDNGVIDISKVLQREYNSYTDILIFEDVINGRRRKGNLMQVSLYNDLIVEGSKKYKILNMLSK